MNSRYKEYLKNAIRIIIDRFDLKDTYSMIRLINCQYEIRGRILYINIDTTGVKNPKSEIHDYYKYHYEKMAESLFNHKYFYNNFLSNVLSDQFKKDIEEIDLNKLIDNIQIRINHDLYGPLKRLYNIM